MFGSLTVLPAVLSKLGDRVDKGRIPFLHRLRNRDPEKTVWARIVNGVLKRPLASALISGGLLVALAVPTLGLDTRLLGHRHAAARPRGDADLRPHPGRLPGREHPGERGGARPTTCAAARPRRRSRTLRRQAAAQPELFEGRGERRREPRRHGGRRRDPDRRQRHRRARPRARSTSCATRSCPPPFGSVQGAEANVTGITAGTEDFNSLMQSRIAAGCSRSCSSAAFVLLLVTFRSIVIPLKAIALNLLSVGAAYGLLVLVFQEGVGQGLLGFEYTGRDHRLAAAVPVRGAVRPVDGLPRVHPHPGARGVRPRA